jgi:hypothetical protein
MENLQWSFAGVMMVHVMLSHANPLLHLVLSQAIIPFFFIIFFLLCETGRCPSLIHYWFITTTSCEQWISLEKEAFNPEGASGEAGACKLHNTKTKKTKKKKKKKKKTKKTEKMARNFLKRIRNFFIPADWIHSCNTTATNLLPDSSILAAAAVAACLLAGWVGSGSVGGCCC